MIFDRGEHPRELDERLFEVRGELARELDERLIEVRGEVDCATGDGDVCERLADGLLAREVGLSDLGCVTGFAVMTRFRVCPVRLSNRARGLLLGDSLDNRFVGA